VGNELAVLKQQQAQPAVVEFNEVQTRLLRETVAQGCDENEFLLFLEMARAKRLNPFDGQIRPVKRWDSTLGRNKMTVQVGIDGYRVIATRTGELAGIDDAVFDTEDADHPKWAKTTVYRYGKNGDRNPFTATARYSEYVQRKKPEKGETVGEPNSMWSRMPYLMTAKVSEALALRKAFPDELSGVYTNEEMGQASNGQPDDEPQPRQSKPQVSMPQPKSEDKPTLNIVEMSNAVIKSRKEGKEDTLWMTTSVGVVVVSATTAAKHPFSIGDAFSFKAVEKTGKEIKFFMVNEVTGYVHHFDDPLPPMEDGPLPEKPKDSMDQAMEEGAFDQNPTGTLEENSKVGKKREIRLYTLMTNNKAKTGLTREIVHEILDAMSPPVAHLSDLNMDMYPVFVKIMTGEQDWRDLF